MNDNYIIPLWVHVLMVMVILISVACKTSSMLASIFIGFILGCIGMNVGIDESKKIIKWCVWEDGSFCEIAALEKYTWLSDNFEIWENDLSVDEMEELMSQKY